MKTITRSLILMSGTMLGLGIPGLAQAQTPAAKTASQPSRAQQLMGDIDPKLAQLTDEVLLGDVWERPGLAKRDRSLVTVAALIALNRPEQLRSHMQLARRNGVTETEIVEAITQLAFYAGWPNAINAVGVAREVFHPKSEAE
ncbi:carboxymuconolactone decarboxylase family protein [Novosphingobium resinovorum]|uniref:Carboxymuconolactone decarboxylase n=1 Tax=Novosphingobium resinovorum TaxID=158500 RepID=A0A031JS14_9SPHN|nr:carboxymuconolactone decarboxylase family protein [Novosphingobium resinovorum]AOR79311.1 cytochrome D ubiquinol oxidase subunit II [Novosphingobium resinovorum]EZP79720.1 Carboxymuconolactone decarboxylase [Novosphingobium resinovorum]